MLAYAIAGAAPLAGVSDPSKERGHASPICALGCGGLNEGTIRENPTNSLHWHLPQEKRLKESAQFWETEYDPAAGEELAARGRF